MIDKAYESYKNKCKELGFKPSSKDKLFAYDILKEQNENHVDIAVLSSDRKRRDDTR